MSSPIDRRGQKPDVIRRSGMGRFDFSKSSQRATNAEGAEFSDRHGNNVVQDRFGNRHLVRNGEARDFSYQDKYHVDVTKDDAGVVTADVHMDQDPVIDRIIEGVEGMLRFHKTGDSSAVRQLMSGDLADQFEQEVATDDEDKERRVASLERLVAFGRQYQRQRGQGGGVYDEPEPPAPPPPPDRPDRFLDEFMSGIDDEEMFRSGAVQQARPRPKPSHVPRHSHGENGSRHVGSSTRSAMLCNSCDEEVSPGMRFCPSCGSSLR